MKQRIKYFLHSLIKSIAGKNSDCPSCGCSESAVVQRKYVVTALRRCARCRLMFRTPTTTKEENVKFYSREYKQGFTTTLPNEHELRSMVENEFVGSEKDYQRHIKLLEYVGAKAGDRLFDFGCSWGYGSWQFMRQGFQVEAYEVSGVRAAYAQNKLGVKAHSALARVERGSFDIFFSSHVLEHVPSVKEAIEYGLDRVRPGGIFMAMMPNGSMAYRDKNEDGWTKSWGLVHPNLLDEQFYLQAFPTESIYLASNPYDAAQIADWAANGGRVIGRLDGDELMVIVRKTGE